MTATISEDHSNMIARFAGLMGLVASHIDLIEPQTDRDGWALNGIGDICKEVAHGLAEIEGHKKSVPDED